MPIPFSDLDRSPPKFKNLPAHVSSAFMSFANPLFSSTCRNLSQYPFQIKQQQKAVAMNIPPFIQKKLNFYSRDAENLSLASLFLILPRKKVLFAVTYTHVLFTFIFPSLRTIHHSELLSLCRLSFFLSLATTFIHRFNERIWGGKRERESDFDDWELRKFMIECNEVGKWKINCKIRCAANGVKIF